MDMAIIDYFLFSHPVFGLVGGGEVGWQFDMFIFYCPFKKSLLVHYNA